MNQNHFIKIDLHCHLDGSIPQEGIRTLAKKAGVTLPFSEEELKKKLQVEEDCRSLKEYLERFDLPLSCLISKESFEIATYEVMKSAAVEGTKYIEIRFAPLLSANGQLSSEQIVESVIKGLKKAEDDFLMKGNIILCAMRHMNWQQNMEVIRLAKKYLGQGVCAVDLAGDEASFPVLEQQKVFQEAVALGVPFTIHAGECGSAQSIKNAVELGAKRIGHGIAMAKDESVMELCKKNHVGIEMCPISNLQTKAVSSMEEYPFRTFWDKGLLVTVNTDNRTVSGTTIEKELNLLEKHGLLKPEERVQLMKNAVEISFADQETKDWLLKQM